MSEVVTSPPHNPDIIHGPVVSNTYTNNGNLIIKENPRPNPKPVSFEELGGNQYIFPDQI